MKVKNIMFSGFMAVVLAGVCGAASAAEMTGDALVVASKGYVDAKVTKLNTADTQMSEKITALENANKEGGDVAKAIAAAQGAADAAQLDVDTLAEKMDLADSNSDLSKALAAKENTANKIATTDSTYFTGGKVADGALTSMVSDNTNFPTVAAAVQIADAKASEVLKKVDSNAGEMAEIASTVETLAADENTPGSVKNQVKVEADRAKGEEGRIEGLVTAETQRAEGEESRIEGLVTAEANRAMGVEQGLQNAIDAITNGDTGALAQAKGYADGLVAAEKERAEGEEGRIEGLVTAEKERAEGKEAELATAISNEKTRAEGIEQGLQDSIDAINDTASGIYAQAKEYTDAGLAKLYSNASDCITKSASKHCIMSAHADALGNPVYVWIDLTAPAE